jgi:hypothetical protein
MVSWRSWFKPAPRPMERTLADDVKVILGVSAGASLAVLSGLGEWSMVLAGAVGLVVFTAVLNVVRRARREH